MTIFPLAPNFFNLVIAEIKGCSDNKFRLYVLIFLGLLSSLIVSINPASFGLYLGLTILLSVMSPDIRHGYAQVPVLYLRELCLGMALVAFPLVGLNLGLLVSATGLTLPNTFVIFATMVNNLILPITLVGTRARVDHQLAKAALLIDTYAANLESKGLVGVAETAANLKDQIHAVQSEIDMFWNRLLAPR